MTKEEEAPGRKSPADARHDSAHHLRAEVHHHVAEEDDVKSARTPEVWIVVDEVSLFERRHGAHFFVQPKFSPFQAKVARSYLRGGLSKRPRRVARAPRPLDHQRLDVDPENLDEGPFRIGKVLANQHRERIGLFAGSASGGKHLDTA